MLDNVLNNFPDEIKNLNQWFLADHEKTPCLRSGNYLIPVDPQERKGLSFSDAYQQADELDCLVGFFISKNDPYACIDLDVKDASNTADEKLWTTDEQKQRYLAIIEYFNSYTETSTSGKGVHIWIKAKINGGRRRDGVEIYSQNRFMVCTGNNFGKNNNVEDRQIDAMSLAEQLGEARTEDDFKLVELEPTETDEVIWERATSAENSSKFINLCQGDWAALGYPSQSEADLSLMSMFTYYSESNEQCRRMFRMTNLGSRKKANKSNYHVDRLLKIIRLRQMFEKKQREAAEIDAKAVIANLNKAKNKTNDEDLNIGKEFNVTKSELAEDGELDWPPGLTGELAKYIYHSSMRPVKTIAIITAIAALAGMCGRQWNITRSGLNMYLVLIAKSAIGKEAMHSGLSAISNQLDKKVPGIAKFFDFTSYASGQALLKAVIENPCTININSEWGRQMQRLAVENGQSPIQMLRTVMTQLYQKSDQNSVVSGIGYSDKANNINCASGVSYSMIGESTPDTFYESITRAMMEDGFLSRFNFFEYTGNRPKANRKPVLLMNPDLLESLCCVAIQSVQLASKSQVTMVEYADDTWQILCDFDNECDKNINAHHDEAMRQMWNRAHLKVCRMSAILAVADNPYHPVVYTQHVKWALSCVRADMKLMMTRIAEGAIGKDDNSRERQVISFVAKYFKREIPDSYVVSEKLRQAGIISRASVTKKMHSVSAFNNHRLGTSQAVDLTLRSLCDSGLLCEVTDRAKLDALDFRGKCYYPQETLFKLLESEDI